MIKIKIPKDVKLILNILNDNNYEAYVVGGCVRDSILNRSPNDWDICTSAKVEDMIDIFIAAGYEVIPTGIKHGTITVVINKNTYEVTTFRIDGEYSDSRHPDYIEFTTDIVADLSRRDFTINAIAYNPKTGIVDPFLGLADIENKFIKCVGNPQDRFSEDALRILRAIRFSCQLDFTIEPDTYCCIKDMYRKLEAISQERITAELNKMIMCDSFYQNFIDMPELFSFIIPELEPCVNFNQNNPHHNHTVYDHIAYAISYAPKDLITKLALLFHDIGKPNCKTDDENGISHYYGHAVESELIADTVMKRMKYDNDTRQAVVELVKYHDSTVTARHNAIKKWLNKIGEHQLRRLIKIRIADVLAQKLDYKDDRIYNANMVSNIIDEVIAQESCFLLKDLKVSGKQLLAIGFKEGPQIGQVLAKLLQLVIDDDIENDEKILLEKAKELFDELNN